MAEDIAATAKAAAAVAATIPTLPRHRRLHPRQDPARRPCPLPSWPAADRRAWERAQEPGDVLEPGGRAAGWSRHTRRGAEGGWGAYLTWLVGVGLLRTEEPGPSARLRPERLAAYIQTLRERGNKPQTILSRVEQLDRFLHAIDPGCDRSCLRRAAARLRAEPGAARGSGKRARLRLSDELFALGCRLMAEADAEAEGSSRTGGRTARQRGVAYRDGLCIALLAARPLRRGNFAGLTLGRHLLQEHGRHWRLVVPAVETKTGRAIDLPFPAALVPALERYLAVHRPVLAGLRGRWHRPAGGALWLSADGSPLSEIGLYLRVVGHTEAAFGAGISPHLFRDAAATSLAIRDPAQVRIAAQVLGHASFATTERHYNLARALDAAAAWHEALEQVRSGA